MQTRAVVGITIAAMALLGCGGGSDDDSEPNTVTRSPAPPRASDLQAVAHVDETSLIAPDLST